jgi:hypothetical protein
MKKLLLSILSGIFVSSLSVLPAAAATTVIVTPTNTHGWSTADTRPGGAVNFVMDSSAPGNPHNGALQLTTDVTTAAKAQYMHDANTALSSVNELSYYTKQNSAIFPEGDPSYQLAVCLNGTPGGVCNGFSTLVFEPYQNPGNNGNVAVVNGVWQQWDVDAGQFWSTRTVVCTGGPVAGQGVTAGGGGAPFYPLSLIKTMCPNAVAVGFGVNIGSFNPGYNVETDLVNFNGTTYNFEPFQSPSDKNECKKGGWQDLTDQNGQPFKNQGECVSWTNGHGR